MMNIPLPTLVHWVDVLEQVSDLVHAGESVDQDLADELRRVTDQVATFRSRSEIATAAVVKGARTRRAQPTKMSRLSREKMERLLDEKGITDPDQRDRVLKRLL